MADARKNEIAAFWIKSVQGAKQVGLGSSFNNWEPVSLKLRKDGTYALLVRVGREAGSVDMN